jgi:hypothetical protein
VIGLLLEPELLTESGSLFVQKGDENVHHVRELIELGIWEWGISRALIALKKRGQTSQILAQPTSTSCGMPVVNPMCKLGNGFRIS